MKTTLDLAATLEMEQYDTQEAVKTNQKIHTGKDYLQIPSQTFVKNQLKTSTMKEGFEENYIKTVHFAKKGQTIVNPVYKINGFCLQECSLVASTVLK